MLYLILAAILLVHLDLEYRIWVRKEKDIFRKYRDETTDPMVAAKWAYYAKAVWLVLLVTLQTLGIEFLPALVYSFASYAALVAVLLKRGIYSAVQLALALGCLGVLLAKSV